MLLFFQHLGYTSTNKVLLQHNKKPQCEQSTGHLRVGDASQVTGLTDTNKRFILSFFSVMVVLLCVAVRCMTCCHVFMSCQHDKKIFARHYVFVKASVCLSLCGSSSFMNIANSTTQHRHSCSFVLTSQVFPCRYRCLEIITSYLHIEVFSEGQLLISPVDRSCHL